MTQRSVASWPGPQPVHLDALCCQVLTNSIADSVGADCGDEANLLSATRDDDRLIGALAAEIVGGSARDDRFARAAESGQV